MPINNFLLPGAKFTPAYEVANSCRFNRGDSPKMSKTLGTPSDADKWTFSAWVKLTDFGTDRFILSLYTDDNNETAINFENGNSINFYNYISGSYAGRLVPNQKLRDPGAWYHLVAVFDSGNGTAGNRMRLYLNGSEITSFATDSNPNQDQDSKNASGVTCVVGRAGTDDYNFGGYMAEVCFCDGQAYAASDFGEFDSDSPQIWKPKDVSGLTFGTNGFYLDFEDSSNLGNDVNGGTDLTEANLAAADQATDTPTNNFATLNPLDGKTGESYTFAEGNTQMTSGSLTRSTIAVETGRWYCEVKCVSTTAWNGVIDMAQSLESGISTNSIALYVAGATMYIDGSNQGSGGYGSSWSANDIMMLGLDLTSSTKKIYFGKNGSWWDTDAFDNANPTTGETLDANITYGFTVGSGSGSVTNIINFGNPAFSISSGNSDANGYGNFEYSVPSGYLSLCTKNLGSDGG